MFYIGLLGSYDLDNGFNKLIQVDLNYCHFNILKIYYIYIFIVKLYFYRLFELFLYSSVNHIIPVQSPASDLILTICSWMQLSWCKKSKINLEVYVLYDDDGVCVFVCESEKL